MYSLVFLDSGFGGLQDKFVHCLIFFSPIVKKKDRYEQMEKKMGFGGKELPIPHPAREVPMTKK